MNANLEIQETTVAGLSPLFVPAFTIAVEAVEHIIAREALLDRAMGEGRRRKSSEKLRRGRLPAEGLAFSALMTMECWRELFGCGTSMPVWMRSAFRFQLCCSARLQSILRLPDAALARP